MGSGVAHAAPYVFENLIALAQGYHSFAAVGHARIGVLANFLTPRGFESLDLTTGLKSLTPPALGIQIVALIQTEGGSARYRDDGEPLDPGCACFVCQRYSRSYLRHLYISGEIVSSILNTYHNLYFYLDLMNRIRQSIALNSLVELEADFRERYAEFA